MDQPDAPFARLFRPPAAFRSAVRLACIFLALATSGCHVFEQSRGVPPSDVPTQSPAEECCNRCVSEFPDDDGEVPQGDCNDSVAANTDSLPPVKQDVKNFLHHLKRDARGVANWNNAAILGLALGGAIGVHQDLDDEVREDVARHPTRWGDGSRALGVLGEAQYQVAALTALYTYSRYQQDEHLHDLSGTLFSSYTITGLSTLAIKGIADTDRPSKRWNNGHWGFPSYHAASAFGIAAVLDEYYGAEAGVPAYIVAGLIGWSRIDEQDHDLSDVLFGAALGYVIGKSVAGTHLHGDGRVRILPWVHPGDGTTGLQLDVRY